MSTKSRCNKIRRIAGCKHQQSLRLLQMFGPDILALSRSEGIDWEQAARSVLMQAGEIFIDQDVEGGDGLMHDRVHKDLGSTRVARTVRSKRGEGEK